MSCVIHAGVLHGPGLWAGPWPVGRPAAHGPGQTSMIFCGPGAGLKLAGPGPGLVSNDFAGCGPSLGLTFPGRAYSESHSCFNLMVKDYLHSVYEFVFFISLRILSILLVLNVFLSFYFYYICSTYYDHDYSSSIDTSVGLLISKSQQ